MRSFYKDTKLCDLLKAPGKPGTFSLSRKALPDATGDTNSKQVILQLACYSQEEIAETCGCEQDTVFNKIKDFMNLVLQNQNGKLTALATHATDFEIPIYNIWKQQEKSKTVEHFGNSEVRWLDNLLYLYTSVSDRKRQSSIK